MKTKIQILILLLFSINSFAHKDTSFYETYGNVKVFMKTGFEYSDLDKIKIIGKLSEKLSNSLNYKDTIFVEYIQDYTDIYTDDLYILEYNNSNFKLIKGLSSPNLIETNNNGLSVRIYANRIKILDVLKFVEYLINNKEETNKYLIQKRIRYNDFENQKLEKPLSYESTEDKLIEKIISKKSILINSLINEKLAIKTQENYGIEIYWQNDKFIFEYKDSKEKKEYVFELNDYYYCVIVNVYEILVFVDENSFYFINTNSDKKKKVNKIKNGNHVPVRVIDLDNKIIISTFNRIDNINIFLKDKNKVISIYD